ncbi:exopolysaccharide biosynthesis polyprenyl glycosylphosphotransferase [Salinarimonas sp.]|uniref:exopolysaccharide biosynthesis polyprenyl glycosylphosphotransferase n=1 Tax=Salinarimonas sp. TaxID=2766526 RepID=UPI0032D9619B
MDAFLHDRLEPPPVDDVAERFYLPHNVAVVGAVTIDFGLGAGTFSLVSWLDPSGAELGAAGAHTLAFAISAGLAVVLALALMRGYAETTLRRPSAATLTHVWAWIVGFLVLSCTVFFFAGPDAVSRTTVAGFFAVGIGVAVPARLAGLVAFNHVLARSRIATRRGIVVDAGGRGDLERALADLASNGIDAVAVYVLDGAEPEEILSQAHTIAARCRDAVGRDPGCAVYLAIDWSDLSRYLPLRAALDRVATPVYVLTDGQCAEILRGKRVETGRIASFEVKGAPLHPLGRAQKRIVDLVLTIAILLVLGPLMALVGLAIRLESPGPALFRQTRRGFSGRDFQIFKFRTMTVCENAGAIAQATPDDLRVTRLGRFLRRTSVDELPQLFNVLRGEMSLVGPRPHALAHDDFYGRVIETYAARHKVKPGITGWAQVNGCRGRTPEVRDMEARVARDLWYIDNWSLWLDVLILLRTIPKFLFDRNAY